MPSPFDLDILNFEPDKDTRKWWTRTRKDPITLYGIEIYGLFRIDRFTSDSVLFLLALVFEIIGLMSILVELDIGVGITIMLIGIFIDMVLAAFHHKYTMGNNCINKNKITIADLLAENLLRAANQPLTAAAINAQSTMLKMKYESEINKEKFKAKIVSALIWFFAVVKIIVFLGASLADLEINTTVFLITLTYLGAAYIHIFRTGYFGAGFICRWVMNGQIKKYTNGTLATNCIIQPAGQPNHPPVFIITDAQLPKSAIDRFHKIELIPSEEYNNIGLNNEQLQELQQGKRLYSFKTHGILSDGALQRLASQAVDPAAKREILLTGISIQLEML